jgi:CPA2 family monovalent cation:H+ antiporter-2
MDLYLLHDLIIVFGLSVFVLYLCHHVKIPVIVGFILTGIMAGPYGLGLIKGVHDVEVLAEIGIVLLLFTIGMQLSFNSLLQIRKTFLLGGSLQVALTFLCGFFIAQAVGTPLGKSVFIGFLLSLSSTAIVLKILQEKAEIDSPHGRTGMAILIFQDIIVVPMMLFTPLLGGSIENLAPSLAVLFAKCIGILLLVIIGAKWIVPQILFQIARTRIRELFLLMIILIGFFVAWLTSSAGLSLALGAFLAGLIISESEYAHQALGNILPFRDVFTSFFFVSIGMLWNISFFFAHAWLILLLVMVTFGIKFITGGIATAVLGFPLRTIVLVGLALSQIGEFSFILSTVGEQYGLFTPYSYQLFISVAVLSLGLSPFVIGIAPKIVGLATRLPFPEKLRTGSYPAEEKVLPKKGHLIIVGFGVNGRNLAQAARTGGIPYVITEINPETVREEKLKGETIYYGDATQDVVLDRADIKEAKVLVVAINDPTATRRIVDLGRRMNPKVYIIARTRYLQELQPLYDLGADEVIPEEFETSVEIFTRVLKKYLVPKDEIDKFMAEIRVNNYQMFRSLSKRSVSLIDLDHYLQGVEVTTLKTGEHSPLAGKTIAEIRLRRNHGLTLLAIQRGPQIISNPKGDSTIQGGDLLIVLGPTDKISEFAQLIADQI